MSHPGIGAMLHYLGGGSKKDPALYYGKTIRKAELVDDKFNIEFEDGIKIQISDEGQSCCESRYLTCDDNLNELVGQKLVRIEVKEATEREHEWATHEICFLEIQGDKSSITFATHNEHNGYYGGFGLSIDEVDTGEGK